MMHDLPQPGEYLYRYLDTGPGSQPTYFRVLRITKSMAWLIWEHDPKPFRKKLALVQAEMMRVRPGEWHPNI